MSCEHGNYIYYDPRTLYMSFVCDTANEIQRFLLLGIIVFEYVMQLKLCNKMFIRKSAGATYS